MSPYALGWTIYGCGVLPAAIALLWVARRDQAIAEHQEAPLALVRALFWPALLVVVLAGLAAGAFVTLSDSRLWWALGYMATRPLYRLHMWCGARLIAADDRKCAERVSAKKA